MTPSAQTSAAAAPLPPLPDLQSGGSGAAQPPDQQNSMASLISGIAPVKQAVDMILAGVKQIVQSGIIPGAEQPCAQIASLATSFLPMAAQQILQPGGGGSAPPAGATAPGPAPDSGAMQPVPGGGQ